MDKFILKSPSTGLVKEEKIGQNKKHLVGNGQMFTGYVLKRSTFLLSFCDISIWFSNYKLMKLMQVFLLNNRI